MAQQYDHSFLEAQRRIGDLPADDFMNAMFGNDADKQTFQQWFASVGDNAHLHTIPYAYNAWPVISGCDKLPDWADTNLMWAGTAFFARYAQQIMNLLGLYALPYCYAGANGAMVLYLSERMRENIGKRLTDTAEFVWNVMAPYAFTPHGKGFAACLKTRLIHSAARYYTLKSSRWNDAWGYPINQEDMAGTNLSFSLIVIRGLRKLGYTVTANEQTAYIHLWKVIGYFSGIKENMQADNGLQANYMEEAIRLHQFGSSHQGTSLTASLLNYLTTTIQDKNLMPTDITQLMRYLLGDTIADQLGINASRLSASRLKILKAAALFDTLKPELPVQTQYANQYHTFMKQSSALAVNQP